MSHTVSTSLLLFYSVSHYNVFRPLHAVIIGQLVCYQLRNSLPDDGEDLPEN